VDGLDGRCIFVLETFCTSCSMAIKYAVDLHLRTGFGLLLKLEQ
jgi:hypothetical protein